MARDVVFARPDRFRGSGPRFSGILPFRLSRRCRQPGQGYECEFLHSDLCWAFRSPRRGRYDQSR